MERIFTHISPLNASHHSSSPNTLKSSKFAPAVIAPAVVAGNDWLSLQVEPMEMFTPQLGVSVVVTYYEAPEALRLTLAALEGQTYPRELFEVVIVDDGSRIPLADPADCPLNVKVVHQEDLGFGLARARNTGVRNAAHDVIVFLDCDMMPEAAWLAEHARWHHAASDVLTLGFRTHIEVDGVTAESIRERHGTLENLFRDRHSDRPEWIEFHMSRTDNLTSQDDDIFRVVTGGNLGVSKHFFNRVGSYDETFTQWGAEDTEFGYRAYTQGATLVPARKAMCWHQGPGTTSTEAESLNMELQRAKISQLIAHPSFRRALPGRSFTVPQYVVNVQPGAANETSQLFTVEAILSSSIHDLLVWIEEPLSDTVSSAVHDTAHYQRFRRLLEGDPRVRFGKAGGAIHAIPSAAFHVTIPAGSMVDANTLGKLTQKLGSKMHATMHLADGSKAEITRARALHRINRIVEHLNFSEDAEKLRETEHIEELTRLVLTGQREPIHDQGHTDRGSYFRSASYLLKLWCESASKLLVALVKSLLPASALKTPASDTSINADSSSPANPEHIDSPAYADSPDHTVISTATDSSDLSDNQEHIKYRRSRYMRKLGRVVQHLSREVFKVRSYSDARRVSKWFFVLLYNALAWRVRKRRLAVTWKIRRLLWKARKLRNATKWKARRFLWKLRKAKNATKWKARRLLWRTRRLLRKLRKLALMPFKTKLAIYIFAKLLRIFWWPIHARYHQLRSVFWRVRKVWWPNSNIRKDMRRNGVITTLRTMPDQLKQVKKRRTFHVSTVHRQADYPLGVTIATVGAKSQAVFAASSQVLKLKVDIRTDVLETQSDDPQTDYIQTVGDIQAVDDKIEVDPSVDVVVADTSRHIEHLQLHSGTNVVVLAELARSCSVPAFDIEQVNPIGWTFQPAKAKNASGRTRNADTSHRKRNTNQLDTHRQAHCYHHIEDTAEYHSDVIARAATLAVLAASGAVVHIADANQTTDAVDASQTTNANQMRDYLGDDLYDLMCDTRIVTADPHQRENFSIAMRRIAMRDHSLRARARQITAGASKESPKLPTVSVLLATHRPHMVANAIRSVASQTYPELELILALHDSGYKFNRAVVERLVEPVQHPCKVIMVGEEQPLGTVLNEAVQVSTGVLLTKFDDDDVYGTEHVWDLVLAHEYSQAALVGKGAEYVYLSTTDQTLHRFVGTGERHKLTLAGGTMLISREQLDAIGGWQAVPSGVDKGLIEDIASSGAAIYCTHGSGYMLVRHGLNHTWRVDASYFIQQAKDIRDGCDTSFAGITS